MTTRAIVISIGLLCCALVFMGGPWWLDIERFDYLKELVLGLTAMVVLVLSLKTRSIRAWRPADCAMAAFVLAGILGSIHARNPSLAIRASTVSLSTAVIFWAVRGSATARSRDILLFAAALTTAVAAGLVLAEGWGLVSGLSLPRRAPGGTLGNRNYAGHFLAIGSWSVMYWLTRARGWKRMVTLSVFTAVVTAIVMTRSRAAWTACLSSGSVLAVVLLLRRSETAMLRRRALDVLCASLAGIILASLVQTRLQWHDDRPYQNTFAHLLDYEHGTGHGRLLQYRNSLGMLASHPWLGVGPGNWTMHYPDHAQASDPSYHPEQLWLTPAHATSDWVAFASERGVLGVLLMLATLALCGWACWKRISPDRPQAVVGLLALMAAVVVATFDCVLQLAAPSLLLFAVLGAATSADDAGAVSLPRGIRAASLGLLLLAESAGMIALSRSVGALHTFAATSELAKWDAAAQHLPDHERANAVVAKAWLRAGRCDRALEAAQRALRIRPSLRVAQTVVERCEISSARP